MRCSAHTLYKSQSGFTAVEIAMVASVIAILALLILPMFRDRSEEAKLVAVRDELQSLAKAIMLAQADTGRYHRLQDLDNGQDPGITRPDISIPIADAQDTLTANQRYQLTQPTGETQIGASYWRGPYISFQKSISYADLFGTRPYLFRNTQGGPIWNAAGAQGYPKPSGATLDNALDRMPVDPWGSPYIFIAETTYGGHRMLFSLGPNGIPGNTSNPDNPAAYYPPPATGGVIGTEDDVQFLF